MRRRVSSSLLSAAPGRSGGGPPTFFGIGSGGSPGGPGAGAGAGAGGGAARRSRSTSSGGGTTGRPSSTPCSSRERSGMTTMTGGGAMTIGGAQPPRQPKYGPYPYGLK